MKPKTPTFKQLLTFLKQLGFSVHKLEGSVLLVEHAKSGAEIRFNEKPHPRALPLYIMTAKITLDGFGLMDRDEFDRRFLGNGSLRRRASA